MSEPANTRATAPFWRTALALWLLALCGVALVMPYVAVLEHSVLAAAAARARLDVRLLLLASSVQSAVLLAVAVAAGLWAARKLDLGTPLLDAALIRGPLPARTLSTLLIALAIGAATGLAIMALDRWVFAPMPSVAVLLRNAGGAAAPSRWLGLMASFYGALDEEVLMRLGLVSLLALTLRWLLAAGDRERRLPAGVFWVANVAAAVLFGLGHLPATAALAPLTSAVVLRAVVLNGLGGLVFGALYRRWGLEWAMAAHFGTDLVLHVLGG